MIEKILKILSEPVLTTDGRSHYIDESHRRYLASRIAALLEGDEEGLLTEADQILSYLCAEIKGMGLSDEDYEIVNNMTGEDVIGMTMDAQFGRITAIQLAEKIVERCKATSQATVDKIVNSFLV